MRTLSPALRAAARTSVLAHCFADLEPEAGRADWKRASLRAPRVGLADPSCRVGQEGTGLEQRALQPRQSAGHQIMDRIGEAKLPIDPGGGHVGDGDEAAPTISSSRSRTAAPSPPGAAPRHTAVSPPGWRISIGLDQPREPRILPISEMVARRRPWSAGLPARAGERKSGSGGGPLVGRLDPFDRSGRFGAPQSSAASPR